MGEERQSKKWSIFEWILLITIILMVGAAIAYFVFDFPITFIPIIFVFPFFGGMFRKKNK